ncbi:MAG: hypothetical protein AAGC60_20775 [Acidobacteriota bacterium]
MTKVRYRRVSIQLWSDSKIRALGRDAALVWLYLLTHPTLLAFGCMRARPSALALEIPWLVEPEAFEAAFEKLVDAGMVWVDEDPDALFLALPKFLIHNPPYSPKVVKSWHRLAGLVPECPGRDRYFARVCQMVEDRGERFAAALPEVFLEARKSEEGTTAHA